MELLEQRMFIKEIPPFDRVDEEIVDKIAENLDIAYFKADETVLDKGAMPEFLYFIIKGVVQEKEGDEVLSLYSKQELFDPVSLIEKYAKHTFVTVEETLCYLLPSEIFLQLLHENDYLESYFFQTISQKLQQAEQNRESAVLADFMMARVEDAYLQKPLIVKADTSLHEAVVTWEKFGAGALLVEDESGLGIVTDADLRKKFIIGKGDFDMAVGSLANRLPVTVPMREFLFNAQLLMTKYAIKHLVVTEEDQVVGILDQLSLASFFASHTYAIAHEIEMAKDVKELQKASEDLIKTVKALYAKGVKVRYIARLISQLNAKIFAKLFMLLAPDVLKMNACIIVMGSEGREEQILKTDQDNALIVSDACTMSEEEIAAFAHAYTKTLIAFGYPPCPGEIMLSNAKWRKSVHDFQKQIDLWLERKSADDLMELAIFYDSTAVAGDGTLLERLKRYLLEHLPSDQAFFAHFTSAVESFEVPLGIFSDFVVEKKGVHKNELDIKKGGIFPIVHGVRALALEHGLKETNSVDRLKRLNDMGVLDKTMTADLIESFTYLMQLRLGANLHRLERGEEMSNYIEPKKLSGIEKDLLKDALKTVASFKKFLVYHYKLNLLG